jgi:lipoprotein-anchoring transpeptidase ErfK/SrfK
MNGRTWIKTTGTATPRVSQHVAPRVASPRLLWKHVAVALLAVALVVAPTSVLAAPHTQDGGYVVQYGDTLAGIAARMGVSVSDLAEANGILDENMIYVDEVLVAPGAATSMTTESDSTSESWGSGPRWIDIDLSQQWLTAYEGDTPVFGTLVSTGIDGYNTPAGEFAIDYMLDSQTMSGDDYYLPDVPYVMYFYGADAIHGTYWHNNFGYPMSHGCVNLPTDAAGWLYDWASIGTPVVAHY